MVHESTTTGPSATCCRAASTAAPVPSPTICSTTTTSSGSPSATPSPGRTTHHRARAGVAGGIHDPLDHRFTADRVQHLGRAGVHPRAVAGGHDQDREGLGHGARRAAPKPPSECAHCCDAGGGIRTPAGTKTRVPLAGRPPRGIASIGGQQAALTASGLRLSRYSLWTPTIASAGASAAGVVHATTHPGRGSWSSRVSSRSGPPPSACSRSGRRRTRPTRGTRFRAGWPVRRNRRRRPGRAGPAGRRSGRRTAARRDRDRLRTVERLTAHRVP